MIFSAIALVAGACLAAATVGATAAARARPAGVAAVPRTCWRALPRRPPAPRRTPLLLGREEMIWQGEKKRFDIHIWVARLENWSNLIKRLVHDS